MKNATATSHGRSRLLEADGPDGMGGELAESTEFLAMEWSYYSTNEPKKNSRIRHPIAHDPLYPLSGA
jgi:hypothetical protein